MGVKTAIGHEFVDKQELATAMAPSDELNEVAVSRLMIFTSEMYSFLPCLEVLDTLFMAT